MKNLFQPLLLLVAGATQKELARQVRLTKSLWSFSGNRIAVRFQYEYHDVEGRWFRAYGNELRGFDEDGLILMRRREASINDVPNREPDRKFFRLAPGSRRANDAGILA